MSEEHKAKVRQFVEKVINGEDLDALDELIHPDYVDRNYEEEHVKYLGLKTLHGPDAVRAWVPYLRSVYPDLHQEIHDLCAEGDMVAWRSTQEGTPRGFNDGKSAGVNAEERVTRRMEMHLVRFRDGMMVEHWGPFGRRAPK